MSKPYVDPPEVEPGLWMDASDVDRSTAGCKVCGWETTGQFDVVQSQFLKHEHDPIFDIERRLYGMSVHRNVSTDIYLGKHYVRDVLWLLDNRVAKRSAS